MGLFLHQADFRQLQGKRCRSLLPLRTVEPCVQTVQENSQIVPVGTDRRGLDPKIAVPRCPDFRSQFLFRSRRFIYEPDFFLAPCQIAVNLLNDLIEIIGELDALPDQAAAVFGCLLVPDVELGNQLPVEGNVMAELDPFRMESISSFVKSSEVT